MKYLEKMKSEIQYRQAPEPIKAAPINQRANDGGQMIVEGYAAVFNQSTNLGQFYELIAPGAFDAADMSDVRFLVDHTGVPLGRSSAGTMSLEIDGQGLRYRVTLPDTARGRELYTAISRGDISQSSFAFTIEAQTWTESNGQLLRSVDKIGTVLDASAVTFPAYPTTSVEIGSPQLLGGNV